MEWPTLRLEGGPQAQRCEIWLNGQKLETVTSVTIEAGVRKGPIKITLQLFGKIEAEVSGNVEFQMETLRDALVTIVAKERG